ncbi:hypothetical protein PDO_3478 [Rhizobium sp. PDO1-076]|uniref:hypothetical protein n=1 Tax=Rhizobium sp. PDO1-076 TaxID=1125979 RepID=UPI00024E32F5|nr:hypothetical protein [Rhizobium sp. PDO1-076]EHS49087.1 hypothetical protein PDO_3478 [Rhizobium sp. PDO1-076]
MRILKRILTSVLFWFIGNTIALCAILVAKFYLGVFTGPVGSDVFDVIFNLLSGGLISFLFYFLVVYVPERRRAKILKNNVISIYQRCREDIVTSVVMASVQGGRKDLSTMWSDIKELAEVEQFKAAFSGGRLGNEGFYAFENQMNDRTYEFDRIIQDFKILAAELSFFLHNYSQADAIHFISLKRLELSLLSLIDSQPGYDESKPFCSFLYRFLAGFDPIDGHLGRDVYLDALRKI